MVLFSSVFSTQKGIDLTNLPTAKFEALLPCVLYLLLALDCRYLCTGSRSIAGDDDLRHDPHLHRPFLLLHPPRLHIPRQGARPIRAGHAAAMATVRRRANPRPPPKPRRFLHADPHQRRLFRHELRHRRAPLRLPQPPLQTRIPHRLHRLRCPLVLPLLLPRRASRHFRPRDRRSGGPHLPIRRHPGGSPADQGNHQRACFPADRLGSGADPRCDSEDGGSSAGGGS